MTPLKQTNSNKEFLYKIEKQENEDFIEIFLYYYNTETYKIKKIVKQENYIILIKKTDFQKLNLKSNKINFSKNTYYNFKHEEIIKLKIKSKEIYKYLKSKARELNIKLYENDLSSENRYIIDHQTKIYNSANTNKLDFKYLIFDIEAINLEQNYEIIQDLKIILISLFFNKEKFPEVLITSEYLKDKTLLNKLKTHNFKEFTIKIFKTEKELLQYFINKVIEYEPQLITGWNVINFDINLLQQRFKEYQIPFKFSKFDEQEAKLRISRKFFTKSTINSSGVIIYDSIDLLKDNSISVKDYKLNTAAKEILSDTKIDLDSDDNLSIEEKGKIIHNHYEKEPVKLIKYNFKDSKLVYEILTKLNLINLMLERSIITNTPLQKVSSPINTLDIIYITALHNKNIVAESLQSITKYEQIIGAFVVDPIKGYHNDIFVFDFKSLYSTIIVTFNLDPYTYDLHKGTICSPNGAKFRRKKGILPKIIQKLLTERDKAKKEKNTIKSTSLKLTMNSFYGAVASPHSRFYNKDLGNAITSFARKTIKDTITFAENNNSQVIYGDTDSLFIKFNRSFKNKEEKLKYGKFFAQKINQYFLKKIKKEYNLQSYLQIEFEKIYTKFFISTKKRYVGLNAVTNDYNFVGLEVVRGDWTELAKDFQKKLVRKIFTNINKKEIKNFILTYISELKKGKFDNKLIYSKKIMKPLEEYVKTTPPHVKAARELHNFKGRIIKYVITNKGPKHIYFIKDFSKLHLKYDYEHYIEKQLKSVAKDLLKYLNLNFEEIISQKKQNTLNKFF